jgi:ribonucleotide reductase beta subunit family protein with ferritin-like domain
MATAPTSTHGVETILTELPSRFVKFPIRHLDVWSMYKKAVSAFWTAEEVDLTKDANDWAALSENERHFVKHVLAFFAGSDGIVNENLGVRFMNDVKVPEARSFYGFQVAMENIHSEMYSLLIDTYITDAAEKVQLFESISTMPCIGDKARWALRWIDGPDDSFAERLIAFACVEGIFFSGAFCSIFWLKERGVLPGLTTSNEFISRDEALHVEFAVLLYSKLEGKLLEERVHAIVADAVEIERAFIVDALPCSLLGMNACLMTQYVRFVADRLLTQLGCAKLYNDRNPFGFMDRICLEGKANFFEHRESNYAKANVGGADAGGVDQQRVLALSEDF